MTTVGIDIVRTSVLLRLLGSKPKPQQVVTASVKPAPKPRPVKPKPAPLSELRRELNNALESIMPTALALTRDRDQARDLVQETALRALRAEGQYTPGTNLKAWLQVIMRNEWTSRLRNKSRRQMSSIDDVSEGVMAERPLQEDPLVIRDFSKAISLTPLQQRGCLALVTLGFSYDEIAEIMCTTVGTVKSRLWRGRERVKAALS